MTSLPINTSGTNELVFNSRYASVKSLFLHTSSTNTNGKFDSFNPAKGGSLQFNIAGKYYPQRPLVDGSITPNLKQAVGSIYDRTNNMSITNGEFLCTLGTPTSIFEPAKIYPGINTSITPFSDSVLLSGTSTESSPISVRLDIVTPTQAACNPSLLVYFDVLIAVEPKIKNASVRQ